MSFASQHTNVIIAQFNKHPGRFHSLICIVRYHNLSSVTVTHRNEVYWIAKKCPHSTSLGLAPGTDRADHVT